METGPPLRDHISKHGNQFRGHIVVLEPCFGDQILEAMPKIASRSQDFSSDITLQCRGFGSEVTLQCQSLASKIRSRRRSPASEITFVSQNFGSKITFRNENGIQISIWTLPDTQSKPIQATTSLSRIHLLHVCSGCHVSSS